MSVIPGRTLIFPSATSLANPTEVIQVPHQDGGPNGPCPGCVALRRVSDNQVATFGSGTLEFKPMGDPGAGERVYDGGNVYLYPTNTPVVAFLKSQPYNVGGGQ